MDLAIYKTVIMLSLNFAENAGNFCIMKNGIFVRFDRFPNQLKQYKVSELILAFNFSTQEKDCKFKRNYLTFLYQIITIIFKAIPYIPLQLSIKNRSKYSLHKQHFSIGLALLVKVRHSFPYP
jgi:hypothetical protein